MQALKKLIARALASTRLDDWLVDGWRSLHRTWSVQLMVLLAILSFVIDYLPILQGALPAKWYGWVAVIAVLARAIRQTRLDAKKNGGSDAA